MIPQGWQKCFFGDVAIIRNGYAFKSAYFSKVKTEKNSIPLIRQSQLGDKKVELYAAVYLPNNYLEVYKDFIVKKGDVLIGMSGSIGKTCIYDHDFTSLQNQRTGLIKPKIKDVFNNKFFLFYLETVENLLKDKSKGVGVQNVSGKEIEQLEFLLPPLAEQHRIVAKIEELFSELDKGIEMLEKAGQQLKVYRQAVLKWAFEGKLTSKKDYGSALPNGWVEASFNKIFSISSGEGLSKSQRNESGEFFVYGGNGISGKHDQYTYEDPQLIIGRVGALCGNVHITKPKSWITDNAFVVRFSKMDFDIKFLYYLILNSNFNALSSSTAQPVISQAKIYPLLTKFPRLKSEQSLLVQEIESRLSSCDKLEQSIKDGLIKCFSLRQSILMQAFEGTLTSQCSIDEPASVLLERIKRESSKTAPNKITRPKKATA